MQLMWSDRRGFTDVRYGLGPRTYLDVLITCCSALNSIANGQHGRIRPLLDYTLHIDPCWSENDRAPK